MQLVMLADEQNIESDEVKDFALFLEMARECRLFLICLKDGNRVLEMAKSKNGYHLERNGNQGIIERLE